MPLKSHPDAKKCTQCKKNNVVIGIHTAFIIDGKNYRTGLCSACYELTKERALCCPECLSMYKASVAWFTAAKTGTLSIVPCPKHSTSKVNPRVKCDACGVTTPVDKAHPTKRRKWYCMACHSGFGTICAAPYCGTVITTNDPDVVKSPKGMNAYCPDCSLIRTRPDGVSHNWHPLSWNYTPGCQCVGCKTLAGKADMWPAGEAAPIDGVCHYCENTETSSIIDASVDGFFYCHMCVDLMGGFGDLSKCIKCTKKHPNFHFQPVVPGYTNHTCKTCMKADPTYWYCGVGCNTWYPKQAEEEVGCECSGVFPYHYSPNVFNFLTARGQQASDTTPFMGLELEIEAQKPGANKKSGAALVRSYIGDYAYCVHDGTLLGQGHTQHGPDAGGQHGFEVVTHPFTLEWLYENWFTWEALCADLVKKGYRSWEGGRCGIHIHISRACMSEARQRKFISFLWDSPRLSMCIGQRTHADKGLAKFAPFDAEKRMYIMQKVRQFKNPGVASNKHYTAINTNKEKTIELRWFRGTLNPRGILKNIQFIHSAWAFTGQYGHTSANEINYIGWLRSVPQSKQYPDLLDYIERNYVTRR